MSIVLKASMEKEVEVINHLQEATGTISYHIRLDPDLVESATWRECTTKDYFTAKENKLFGGMVEVKTQLHFYGGDTSKEVSL